MQKGLQTRLSVYLILKSLINNKSTYDRLFKKEIEEIKIIEEFLPKQLLEDEVTKIVEDLISQNNISDISGMGLIMSELKKKYSGQLDLGLASKIIKDRINS